MGGRGSRRAAFPPRPAKASPSRGLISFALRNDRQREGLGGGAAHGVDGGEVQGVRAVGPHRRGAAEHAGGRVERHAARQRIGAALDHRRGRDAGGRHREAARRALLEGGAAGAGDGQAGGRSGCSLDVERKWGKSSMKTRFPN